MWQRLMFVTLACAVGLWEGEVLIKYLAHLYNPSVLFYRVRKRTLAYPVIFALLVGLVAVGVRRVIGLTEDSLVAIALGATGAILLFLYVLWYLFPYLKYAKLAPRPNLLGGMIAALCVGCSVLIGTSLAVISLWLTQHGTVLRYAGGAVLVLEIAGGIAIWALPTRHQVDGLPKPKPRDRKERVNVVLVTFDCLRADRLGYFGYEKARVPGAITHTIDSLAKSGTIFTQCIATSNYTPTAMASLLTGCYPSVALASGRTGLRNGTKTIAELFRANGYVTVGLSANSAYLTKYFGFHRGFDVFESLALYKTYRYNVDNTMFQSLLNRVNGQQLSYVPADFLVQRAKELVEKLETPFFLWVHFMEPHQPYGPPSAYRNPWGAKLDKRVRVPFAFAGFPGPVARPYSQAEKEAAEALYDGAIKFADECLGDLLASLPGIDQTIVLFTSDHGEEWFDHGGRHRGYDPVYDRGYDHGHTMYDELIHVPLILVDPTGQVRDSKIERLVSHLDILRTLQKICNLQVDGELHIQGKSLVDLSESPNTYVFCELPDSHYDLLAVRSNEYKLIRHVNNNVVELFDLLHDPHERVNIAGSAPSTVAALMGEIEAQTERNVDVTGKLVLADARRETSAKEGIHPKDKQDDEEQVLERLRALGYLS